MFSNQNNLFKTGEALIENKSFEMLSLKDPINCLTQKSIEQLVHLMVAALRAAIDGIQIAYFWSQVVTYHPNFCTYQWYAPPPPPPGAGWGIVTFMPF